MPGKEKPKATSKVQQQAAGIAHAVQEGKMKGKPGLPATAMAQSMKPGDVKSMASGPMTGKPEHKGRGVTNVGEGNFKVRPVK
jgi:hypothetical protein